jgi:tetratricopeptide (TPR) repeat protein
MARKIILAIFAIGTLFTLSGAKCSRERVQSVEMMNKCVEYNSRNLFPQAIRDCTKAISLDPTNDAAYQNLAMVYISTKEYDQAARHLSKAISLNGTVALWHYQLGEVYQWSKKPEQALPSLQKAVELDPGLFKAHYRMGVVYEELADPQNALQKYTDALMHNSRFFEAYRDLGALYTDYEFFAQAEQVFNEGIKALAGRGEELAVLYHRLGTVYAEQKEYAKAVDEFKQALELKPDMEDAMFSLGWSYSYTNPPNAKIWLDKFVKNANPKTRVDYLSAASARLGEISSGTPYK